MKESMWGYWIIILGISIISLMVLLQSYSTTDEQTFFLVKDSLESALKESVDYQYLVEEGGKVCRKLHKKICRYSRYIKEL